MWSHVIFVTVFITVFVTMVTGRASSPLFTAGVVEDIVKSEVQKKMPSASHKKGKSLKGFHLKEATDAINKLVDESIVDRVQEAEREVSKMLLKSIEHHIQDAGKVLLQQDENVCRDKLDSCDKLADSGVCETSKDAMIVNCPETCNFCGMLKELKLEKSKEEEDASEKPKKKKKHRHKHHRHHAKEFQQTSKLNVEETQLHHQNMLDQTIDHSNLPMAVDNSPETQSTDESSPSAEAPQQENNDNRDYDADQQQQQQQQQEEAERQRQEAERQKEEEEREEQRRREKERRKRKKAAAAAKQHAQLTTDKGKNDANYDGPNDDTTSDFQTTAPQSTTSFYASANIPSMTYPTNDIYNYDPAYLPFTGDGQSLRRTTVSQKKSNGIRAKTSKTVLNSKRRSNLKKLNKTRKSSKNNAQKKSKQVTEKDDEDDNNKNDNDVNDDDDDVGKSKNQKKSEDIKHKADLTKSIDHLVDNAFSNVLTFKHKRK